MLSNNISDKIINLFKYTSVKYQKNLVVTKLAQDSKS